jgi:Tol biopolymer transport system component
VRVGRRLFFTSDRDGASNLYGLDPATGAVRQAACRRGRRIR